MNNKLEQKIFFSPNASSELTALRPIFKKLTSVHQDFGNAFEDECTPWFWERPQIGFLSAAVWLSRGVAIEEFRSAKTIEHDRKTGRGDLRFHFREYKFHVEAKYSFTKNLDGIDRNISKQLNVAARDVRRVRCNDYAKLAICFVVPLIAKSPSFDVYKRCSEWLSELRNENWCDALVWIGTKNGEEPYLGRTHLFPGILLLIRQIR